MSKVADEPGPDTRDLAPLRVAQLTRTPMALAQIVSQLKEDEGAETLSSGDVQAHLDRYVESGLVDQIDEGVYALASIFTDDLERRIAGNLVCRPRSVASLQAELRADDHAANLTGDYLEKKLTDLADRGLVVNLGTFEDSDALADAVADEDGARDLHEDQDAILRERLASAERAWQLDGDQYVVTPLAHDALQVT